MYETDLAFHRQGWAYETWGTHRTKRLVIRTLGHITEDEAGDPIKPFDEAEGPGRESWYQKDCYMDHTVKELKLEGYDPTKLVVLVGELLPLGTTAPGGYDGYKGGFIQDPDDQKFLENIAGTGIVVRKIADSTTALYLLWNEGMDGVSHIVSLPSEITDDRLVVYNEWTTGATTVDTLSFKECWLSKNLTEFCNDFLVKHVTQAWKAPLPTNGRVSAAQSCLATAIYVKMLSKLLMRIAEDSIDRYHADSIREMFEEDLVTQMLQNINEPGSREAFIQRVERKVFEITARSFCQFEFMRESLDELQIQLSMVLARIKGLALDVSDNEDEGDDESDDEDEDEDEDDGMSEDNPGFPT